MIKMDLLARIMKRSPLIFIDGIYVYLTSDDQIDNYVKMALPGKKIMNRQVASDNYSPSPNYKLTTLRL